MSSSLGTPEWWTKLSGKPHPREQTILLTCMVYFWWLFLGGVAQMLFGGIYFGSKQAAQFHLSTPVLQVLYILVGLAMVEMALGILALRWWCYWAGFPLAALLLGTSINELVRWIDGANITLEVGVFTILDIIFVIYDVYFLLQPGLRATLHRATLTRRGQLSPDLVLCVVITVVPALCAPLLVNYADRQLTIPELGLLYFGGGAALIFMAYGALKLQSWVWLVAWPWVAVLLGLAGLVIVDHVRVESVIAGVASVLFALSAIWYLIRPEVVDAFLHGQRRHIRFNSGFVIAGAALAVFAVVIYLLPGELGRSVIAYAVAGLVIGAVVGLIPGTDPVTKLMGFVLGLFLADASYFLRGGLLPYTKSSSAVVVALMLLIITGIAVLFRSGAWFVAMLLGAGTLYGLVEITFQGAPATYVATTTVALVSVLCSFGLGYMVTALLGISVAVPASPETAKAGPGEEPPEVVTLPPDIVSVRDDKPPAERAKGSS